MRSKAREPRSDIYQTITQKLLAVIEANPGDPITTWQRGGTRSVLPANAVTGCAAAPVTEPATPRAAPIRAVLPAHDALA